MVMGRISIKVVFREVAAGIAAKMPLEQVSEGHQETVAFNIGIAVVEVTEADQVEGQHDWLLARFKKLPAAKLGQFVKVDCFRQAGQIVKQMLGPPVSRGQVLQAAGRHFRIPDQEAVCIF